MHIADGITTKIRSDQMKGTADDTVTIGDRNTRVRAIAFPTKLSFWFGQTSFIQNIDKMHVEKDVKWSIIDICDVSFLSGPLSDAVRSKLGQSLYSQLVLVSVHDWSLHLQGSIFRYLFGGEMNRVMKSHKLHTIDDQPHTHTRQMVTGLGLPGVLL